MVNSANGRVVCKNKTTNQFEALTVMTYSGDMKSGMKAAFADNEHACQNWLWLAEVKEGIFFHSQSPLNIDGYARGVCATDNFCLVGEDISKRTSATHGAPEAGEEDWKIRAQRKFHVANSGDKKCQLFHSGPCPFAGHFAAAKDQTFRTLLGWIEPYSLKQGASKN